MSIGQRIAQKRKERGLSQEALGEQLGVSRQAIYKWESDSALPEIEKLIALSRIFSVSVGWLLGEEENSASEPGELTEEQLRMVQEIVDRYLAAQPEPAPPPAPQPRRKRWPWVTAAALLTILFVSLFVQLGSLSRQFDDLNSTVYSFQTHFQAEVYGDISSITDRMEEILQGQNNLVADYSVDIAETDLTADTVTFAVRAVPKTYQEGMTALFVAKSGQDTVELPAQAGTDHAFEGEITCPLTDEIALSVVFITGTQRETQLLEAFDGLLTSSFPDVWIQDSLWNWLVGDQALSSGSVLVFFSALPVRLRFGLFRDQDLVFWYDEEDAGSNYILFATRNDAALDPEHTYCWAAVATDEYGRDWVYFDEPVEYDSTGGSWQLVDSFDLTSDPEGWVY